jgi:hypothetical protein
VQSAAGVDAEIARENTREENVPGAVGVLRLLVVVHQHWQLICVA